MPSLRVLTWNSTGESKGQGADVLAAVAESNKSFSLPVQIVAIQEADINGGTIADVLAKKPPFSAEFVQPQGMCLDHAQPPQQAARLQAYRLSWMSRSNNPSQNLSSTGGNNPSLYNLDPTNDPGGLGLYINQAARVAGGGTNTRGANACIAAATLMRWPIYKLLTRAATTGSPQSNIHFFSWHAPLKSEWLDVDRYITAPLSGPGLAAAFIFLQESTGYKNIRANLTANDVLIVAGDLNVYGPDLNADWIFKGFKGASDNLSHVLAYSPSTAIKVDESYGYDTSSPPHRIVIAKVTW